MKAEETFTIVHKSGTHYDTNDQKFYDQKWERTLDSEKHLKSLISNNPEKFEGCKIENNADI